MGKMINITDSQGNNYLYEEALKALRTNLQFAGRNIKCVLITSCFPNEGKSDICFHLAKEFGRMGKKTVLVDADIRKSVMESRYKIETKVEGLTHYLCGEVDAEAVCCNTNYDNLDVIMSGAHAPNPTELLEDPSLGELMKYLRDTYDYVIVDAPPAVGLSDAAIIGKWCDGALLVVEKGYTSRKVADKVLKQIRQSGCKMLGVVLNKVNLKSTRLYKQYGYYYGYYRTEK